MRRCIYCVVPALPGERECEMHHAEVKSWEKTVAETRTETPEERPALPPNSPEGSSVAPESPEGQGTPVLVAGDD